VTDYPAAFLRFNLACSRRNFTRVSRRHGVTGRVVRANIVISYGVNSGYVRIHGPAESGGERGA